MSLLLGYDVGSSSVKCSLMDSQTGKVLASATSPSKEMEIIAKKIGWAEQDPSMWWDNVKAATAQMNTKSNFNPSGIKAIGISYQMHGLVTIGKNRNILRPAIIWCDSRAVQIGENAAKQIGEEKCLQRLLNLPGNFTASKLKWVKDNEPEIYKQIYKIMLPGDFIAMKMTGEIKTTITGLSEGIMWDFDSDIRADFILENYGISPELLPQHLPSFAIHGQLTKQAADELGLKEGTVITYKGGDQPNNALSLSVLEPGDAAVTAGTSGVMCGITDKKTYDNFSRVNSFAHINHKKEQPRLSVLLCVNGCGVLNSWLKHNMASEGVDYDQMNNMASEVPIGSDGLHIYPYGNGSERVFKNKNLGAFVTDWNFNMHKKAHFLRAAQEGIVFAFNYGLDIFRDMKINIKKAKAGNANMFLSPLFSQAFANVTDAEVEIYDTDGSQGAARGAGIGAGIYKETKDAFATLACKKVISPDKDAAAYKNVYSHWRNRLNKILQAG